MVPINAANLPTGEIRPVEGTAFDLRVPRRVGEVLAADDEQLRRGKGLDHNFVLDRAAGEEFLRSRSTTFPGLTIAELFDVRDGPLHEEIVRNIITINGDDHRRLRSLVNPAFTPRAAARYRPAMRGFLEELWEPVIAAGGACEFVDALAKPYPALTIATVMGAPLSDAPRLHDWSAWIQRQFDPIALSDQETLAGIQDRLLVAARGALRPDGPGRLVYATCTVSKREERMVGDGRLRTLPSRDGTDGFYISWHGGRQTTGPGPRVPELP